MKAVLFGAVLCSALLFLLAGGLTAQSMVANGDYDLEELGDHWTLYGNNDKQNVILYDVTGDGKTSYCNKWKPGSNQGNGGITQEVYMIAGQEYQFDADIAFVCTC